MFSILEITSADFDDDRWRDFHQLMVCLKDEYGSSYKLPDWEELKKTVLSFMAKEMNYRQVLVYEGEKLVGWAEMKAFNVNTPEKLLSVRFDAFYETVPEALSKTLAGLFYEELRRYDIPHVFFVSQDNRLIRTALGWGGEKMHRNDEYVLYRHRADTALMKSWLETIPLRNPGLKLRFFPETPEAYLEPFARVLSQLLNDMPHEREDKTTFRISVDELIRQTIWRRENGIPSYKYLVFNERDEIIGLTMAELRSSHPQEASQAMTGIVGSCRGRGLAKWLKAAMFFRLGEDFPDNRKIITMMRAVNEPIQHINAQMGYMLEREGMEMKITGENLARFLNS